MTFSKQLEAWLESDGPHTLGSLDDLFGEKSFGVLFLFLLALPATPLPTGGLTHIFEIIALVLALELIFGRTSVWLPARWRRKTVTATLRQRTLPTVVRWVGKIERVSSTRGKTVMQNRLTNSVLGIVIFCFTLTAFIAPPFSGLDTLPSLGVVLIALGMILDDIFLAIFGIIVGVMGTALVIFLGEEAYRFLFRLLHL